MAEVSPVAESPVAESTVVVSTAVVSTVGVSTAAVSTAAEARVTVGPELRVATGPEVRVRVGPEVRVTAGPGTQNRRGVRIALRIGAGIAVIVATAAVVGIGPFLQGLAAISLPAILAGLALAAVATAAAAWRWRIVATGYGLPLPWRGAFGAYYRSQFLNAVLPAGVLGDVHRAWAHGHAHARVGVAARAVAVERILGQVVQIAMTLAILLPLGFGSSLVPLVWGAGVLAAAVVLAVAITVAHPRTRRILRREYDMLRPILVRPVALITIATASVFVVSAHVTLFLLACVATGLPLDSGTLAAGLIVLAASAIPINVGGWGPREASAAAAFALLGPGAAAGVTASTAFGVLALIGVLPGVLVLFVARGRRQ